MPGPVIRIKNIVMYKTDKVLNLQGAYSLMGETNIE